MNFQDVLKKSFLEDFAETGVSTYAFLITLFVTALIGLYIFLIYRIMSRKTFYSQSFNISLVALALITAAVIVTIQSSIVISLGMVGALSIVRFRTAIKDPMDLVFLFWSISVGIICGAGLFEVATITSIVLTLFILALSLCPVVKPSKILVINSCNRDSYHEILVLVKKYTKNYSVKSHNITKNGMDMIIELRIKNGSELVKEISAINEMNRVSLLSHDGEVTY